MKTNTILIMLITVLVLGAAIGLPACRKDTLGQKIDDATNSRPAEKLQDKAEDMTDKIKDATN
jgi:hypothetical protein